MAGVIERSGQVVCSRVEIALCRRVPAGFGLQGSGPAGANPHGAPPKRRAVLRRRVRAAALVLAVTAAVWVVPGGLVATLSPEQTARVAEGSAEERLRLTQLRERLTRREAFEGALDRQIAELAEEMNALRARREQRDTALTGVREEVRALERRLDRLVPRLEARGALVDQRQTQAARVVADLAGLSRQVEIDPTVRARLLAISPLMLERLRAADAGVATLVAERDRAAARHTELQDEAPRLLAERQQVERERLRLQQQREVLLERRAKVVAEIEALRLEHDGLAREVLVADQARRLRAEPRASEPALLHPARAGRGVPPTGDAVVKGGLARSISVTSAVRAVQRSASRVMGVAPPPSMSGSAPRVAGRSDVPALPPPPAKPGGALAKSELRAGTLSEPTSLERAATVDVTLLDPGAVGTPSGRVLTARLQRPETPIMPVAGEVVSDFGDGNGLDERGITIMAGAGQAVAAPEDGRIVFAAPFRGYGPLLIIEHGHEYHTLLWGLAQLDVGRGEVVRAGQVVGTMPRDGGDVPKLHVELRRNGRPINPLTWLAASNSKVRG